MGRKCTSLKCLVTKRSRVVVHLKSIIFPHWRSSWFPKGYNWKCQSLRTEDTWLAFNELHPNHIGDSYPIVPQTNKAEQCKSTFLIPDPDGNLNIGNPQVKRKSSSTHSCYEKERFSDKRTLTKLVNQGGKGLHLLSLSQPFGCRHYRWMHTNCIPPPLPLRYLPHAHWRLRKVPQETGCFALFKCQRELVKPSSFETRHRSVLGVRNFIYYNLL